MPGDRPPGRDAGTHVLAPSSGKYFIGWEERSGRGDGAAFVVGRCGMFDDLKVTERFPLTEDGWRLAWQALVRTDASMARRAQADLARQASQARADADRAELE